MNDKVEDKLPVLDGDIFIFGKPVEKNGQVHSSSPLHPTKLSCFARFINLPQSQSNSRTAILPRTCLPGTQPWIQTTGVPPSHHLVLAL
jgi:hypothetical protein